MKVVNLTKYHVNIYLEDGTHMWFAPSGKVAAVEIQTEAHDNIMGIPIVDHVDYFNNINLPEPEEGTIFIVHPEVVEANFYERDDLYAVDWASENLYKHDGRTQGVKALYRPRPDQD